MKLPLKKIKYHSNCKFSDYQLSNKSLPYRTGVAIWCGDDLAPLFQVNSGIPRKDLVSNMTKHNYTVLADIHASTLQLIASVLKNKKEHAQHFCNILADKHK